MRFSSIALAISLAVMASTAAQAERLYGLTIGDRIVTFDSTNPEAILTSRAITGIAPGDTMLGIDVRPADNMLYSIGSSGNIYQLQLQGNTWAATTISITSPSPAGQNFGVDFNPVADRLRVISNTGQNLRINPANGVTIVDGIIVSDSGPAEVLAAAYTNNFAGATSTTLFVLDAANDQLLRSTNPNGGTYTGTNLMGISYQALGFGFTAENEVGFDISGITGTAFANIDSLLWSINLETGAATALGIVGAGTLRSIATGASAVPEPASWAMMIAGFGLAGGALRRHRAKPVSAIA